MPETTLLAGHDYSAPSITMRIKLLFGADLKDEYKGKVAKLRLA